MTMIGLQYEEQAMTNKNNLRPIVWKDYAFPDNDKYPNSGYFHKFAQTRDCIGDVSTAKAQALVEDTEGVVHVIEPERIKFTDRATDCPSSDEVLPVNSDAHVLTPKCPHCEKRTCTQRHPKHYNTWYCANCVIDFDV